MCNNNNNIACGSGIRPKDGGGDVPTIALLWSPSHYFDPITLLFAITFPLFSLPLICGALVFITRSFFIPCPESGISIHSFILYCSISIRCLSCITANCELSYKKRDVTPIFEAASWDVTKFLPNTMGKSK
jgi:hypothetical protein